jgi:hypothetical protein
LLEQSLAKGVIKVGVFAPHGFNQLWLVGFDFWLDVTGFTLRMMAGLLEQA